MGRHDTLTFTGGKLKRYELVSLTTAIPVALLLKCMPGNLLWPMLGVPAARRFENLHGDRLFVREVLDNNARLSGPDIAICSNPCVLEIGVL